jgi:hypothetical protein
MHNTVGGKILVWKIVSYKGRMIENKIPYMGKKKNRKKICLGLLYITTNRNERADIDLPLYICAMMAVYTIRWKIECLVVLISAEQEKNKYNLCSDIK